MRDLTRRRQATRLALAIATICLFAGWAPAALAATPLTPSVTATPALMGTPNVGETLSCSTGSWTNDPTSFTYAWLREGAPIAGQSGSSYVVQSTDEGHAIACEVTANVLGGEYEIKGLPSESYAVSFGPGAEANYLAQLFSGKPISSEEATPVAVTAPGATPNVNASLAVGGEIAGQVTDESGAPLANIEVCIGFLNCKHTNANGEYTFSSLPAGGYKVVFNPDAQDPVWVCEKASCEYEAEGDEVTVTPPSTSAGVDAVLKARAIPVGQISGTVSDSVSEVGLANIQVCATLYEKVSNYYCATTDGSGQYMISNVPAGEEYEVLFLSQEGENENYISRRAEEPWEFTTRVIEVPVTAGNTETVEETLEEGGEIAGQVTDESKQGLAGIEVCATGELLNPFCAKTDANGDYTLVGLPASNTYEVYFAHNQDIAYLPVVRTEVAGTVGSPSTLDVELEEGGSISGSVSTAGGGAFAGGEVCASVPAEGKRCAFTDASGEYMIVGLPTGSDYEVVFHGEQCNEAGCVQDYLGETYSQPVPVKVAEVTPEIDAELAEGGEITGAITVAGGGALAGEVKVCTSAENNAYETKELRKCAQAHEAVGSASATSNALAVLMSPSKEGGSKEGVPKGKSSKPFKLVKKRFDAKTGKLDLFFEVPSSGSLAWKLTFKGTGSKAGKGKGKGVHLTVPFSQGSKTVPAGTAQVKMHASEKAIKALKSGQTLHVSGTFTFKPALGGTPATIKVKTVMREKKKPKKKANAHEKLKKQG